MIDNQLAAQLLFNHRLATQEQIMAVWPAISAEKDVAMLLVERGVLPRQTYLELIAYLRSTASAPAQETVPSAAPAIAVPAAANGPAEPPPPPPIPDPQRTEPPIESFAGPGFSDLPEVERDPSILDPEAENWIPAPDEPAPETRKTTRDEHLRKRASEDAAMPRANPAAEPIVHPPAASRNALARSSGADTGSVTAAPRPARGELRADGPKVQVPAEAGPETSWEELLAYARHHDASDLHLSAGNPILLRRYGSLRAIGQAPLEQRNLHAWVESALDAERFRAFGESGDLEFIYTLPHYGRYRVTVLKQRRGWDVTARVIPDRIRTMEEAGLPEACRELTKWAQGLVLVTGPVGCGKTSTLATLVDIVNRERRDHIISIEDPIEILYPPASCRITQRQIGPHTLSPDAALRAALREDPDIIVISELRDLDTIRLAVSAAETGHLVFGTMNTANATRTLSRLIDSFPPEEQGIVRSMISESLRGVVSQQLLPRRDGEGALPAFEVLLVNTAVANMIRKDEAHQLGTAMLTGKSAGMVLLDDSLRSLVERGLVDASEAMSRASNPKDFERYLGRR